MTDTRKTCPTCEGAEEITIAKPGGTWSASMGQWYPNERTYPCPNPDCYGGQVPAAAPQRPLDHYDQPHETHPGW